MDDLLWKPCSTATKPSSPPPPPSRPADGAELESKRLKARPGEMLLREGLLEAKIAALEGARHLLQWRPRP